MLDKVRDTLDQRSGFPAARGSYDTQWARSVLDDGVLLWIQERCAHRLQFERGADVLCEIVVTFPSTPVSSALLSLGNPIQRIAKEGGGSC